MIQYPAGQSFEGQDFTYHAEGGNTPTGMSGKVYKDSLGIPTIGPGFNLNGGTALPFIQQKGYDIQALKSGQQVMSPEDMKDVFAQTYNLAASQAQDIFDQRRGQGAFAALPKDAQDSLIDMSYNMGPGGLSKWGQTMDLIGQGKFATAANHMKAQPWYSQVKTRGQAIVNTLGKLGDSNQYAGDITD